MSTTLPTLPSFVAGYTVQLADLNNLGYAATFLLNRPMTKIIDTAGGQVIGTSFGPVNFSSALFDTDGMWSSGTPNRLTVQTPGWYRLRYGLNVGTNGGVYTAYVTSTSGSNNPQGAGVTSIPCWGSYTDEAAASNGWCCASGIWPFYLYALDYVQVSIQAASAGSSTGISQPTHGSGGGSYFSLEYKSM